MLRLDRWEEEVVVVVVVAEPLNRHHRRMMSAPARAPAFQTNQRTSSSCLLVD
jgi:hypothetical protein